jgi:hypothetical protein
MMNKNTLKHIMSWQSSCQEIFAPVYPLSNRGANDRTGGPGVR